MLTVTDTFDPALLGLEHTELLSALGGPTLFHMEGERHEPIFLSVLLHGNEPAGWSAARKVLSRYTAGGGDKPLPRSLSLFVGNVAAAAENVRHLDGQPDFNRIWPGTNTPWDGPETEMLETVVAQMRARNPFASIDIHNNSGVNPHYGCVNQLEPKFLYLASLFSRTITYFRLPRGVQSMAFMEMCPSVTVECGRPDNIPGAEHAARFLDAALHLASFPERGPMPQDLNIVRTVARARVPQGVNFSIEGADTQLTLRAGLDMWNFSEVHEGACLGRWDGAGDFPITVEDEDGRDVTSAYVAYHDGLLVMARDAIPAMLTPDAQVIAQDCLCYFMERLMPDQSGLG